MTLTVSISQFRQHLSDYIAKAKDGYTVILKDAKKNEEIVQIMAKKKFNPETFGKTLKAVAGVFTAEKHPEWRTKRDVIRWLQKSRKAADRKF
jgi:antitoxin (DNA-binding transcriptional repressor) of toxin-antitoxin stability system